MQIETKITPKSWMVFLNRRSRSSRTQAFRSNVLAPLDHYSIRDYCRESNPGPDVEIVKLTPQPSSPSHCRLKGVVHQVSRKRIDQSKHRIFATLTFYVQQEWRTIPVTFLTSHLLSCIWWETWTFSLSYSFARKPRFHGFIIANSVHFLLAFSQ